MKVNTIKLKNKIVENDFTQESLAKSIGIGRTTFYRKMNNSMSDFTLGEVNAIATQLDLSLQEVIEIFLDS